MKRIIRYCLIIICLSGANVLAISLLTVEAQTSTPLPVFPLTPGSSIEGNINDSVFSTRYSFESQVGDNVTLQMQPTSGDLDPFLIVFSPDGELLEQNDDVASGSRDAQIVLLIKQAGTYIVEATRFQQETGPSNGTYRLSLAIAGAMPDETGVDPLNVAATFGVPFTYIDYQEFGAGIFDEQTTKQYFAVGGQQGDLIRVTMTNTGGDLVPKVVIHNADLTPISRTAQANVNEAVVYATLPETGWYLIEAAAETGTGSFSLYVDRRAVAVLEVGQTIPGEFTPDLNTISYIINARIGDQVIATLFATEQDSKLLPEVSLLDLSLRNIASQQATDQPSARIRALIPRSGPYILQVTNRRTDVTGQFNLRLSGIPVDITKLAEEVATPATYNNLFKGIITNTDPSVFYRFSGKAGELVTLQMNALGESNLDPYLILMDAALNELAFNDNVGNTPNARIAQFALPVDGDYFILVTRADSGNEASRGLYDLSLTVGQISLLPGVLTATLTWQTDADLNLFVRDPKGRVVSWSRPQISSGGILQIDSNTGCEIPTAQPVEHIYWQPATPPAPGEYEVWVWYQNVCLRNEPATFALQLTFNNTTLLDVKAGDFTLKPDQRLNVALLLTDTGSYVTNPGQVINTSNQRRASEGGDTLLLYGQDLTGTINNNVYARFYQFVAEQGDEIRVAAEAITGDLDPFVVLRDDTDTNLISNDDTDSTTRNASLTYTIPANGLYVIAVTRYGLRDGTTSGDFRLTLQRGN